MVTTTTNGTAARVLAALAGLWRWTHRAQPATVAPMDTHERPVELWSVRRLAEWLGISPQAVFDRIDRGTLVPHYQAKTGNGWVYLFDPARIKHLRKTRA